MKKILCSNPNCKGVFAHQLSDRSVEYGRNGQAVVVSGNEWAVIGTCGETGKYKCDYKTAITCENGKIDTSDLRYEAPETPPVDPNAPPLIPAPTPAPAPTPQPVPAA